MLITQGKTNWKFLLIVIVLAVIVGVVIWMCPEEEIITPQNETTDWVGAYEYSEFAPSNQTWSYRLEVHSEENQLRALLDIDGFQTLARIQAVAEERDGKLDIIFDNYGEGNMHEPYIKGDILFSMAKISNEDYRIIWDKLQSNLLGPGDAIFRKVLINETAEWQTYRSEEYGFEIKYPKDWKEHEFLWEKSEEFFNISFLEPRPDLPEEIIIQGSFKIAILPNPGQISLEEWMKGYKREAATGADLIQGITNMMLDGKIAKRVSVFGFDGTIIETITTNRGFIYNLSFDDPAVPGPSEHENPRHRQAYEENYRHQRIYNQMLSTFRFLN